MTLTPEQLDELEAKLRDPHEYPHGIGTRASLHLVSVYRAALAWSEARQRVIRISDSAHTTAQELQAARDDVGRAAIVLSDLVRGQP